MYYHDIPINRWLILQYLILFNFRQVNQNIYDSSNATFLTSRKNFQRICIEEIIRLVCLLDLTADFGVKSYPKMTTNCQLHCQSKLLFRAGIQAWENIFPGSTHLITVGVASCGKMQRQLVRRFRGKYLPELEFKLRAACTQLTMTSIAWCIFSNIQFLLFQPPRKKTPREKYFKQ